MIVADPESCGCPSVEGYLPLENCGALSGKKVKEKLSDFFFKCFDLVLGSSAVLSDGLLFLFLGFARGGGG